MSGEKPFLRRVWANIKQDIAELRPAPFVGERDMTAAVGAEGGPGSWRRAVPGADVALHARDWADARWSSIYRRGTDYASDTPITPESAAAVAAANLRGRRESDPSVVQGPMMKAAVWTWEVPLYFWFGGMAAGSTFVALGADLAGDHRSARVARAVAFTGLMPCPPLLVMDLGRPERFHHMLRIFKPRSPMSMGSWCLSLFGGLAFLAVGADVLKRPRLARTVGAVNVPVAMYLGSYTGVLLAATAVPLWGHSKRFLGPIFVSTATLTGAASTRLTLSALGMPAAHPTRVGLARIEDAGMASELILSAINYRRLGELTESMESGEGAQWFGRASWLGRAGLAARVLSRRVPLADHVTSVSFMAAALCYRFGWVRAGHASAIDDAAVAATARAAYEPGPGPTAGLQIYHQGQKPPEQVYGE